MSTEQRTAHSTVQVLGLGLMSAAVALLAVVALIIGSTDDLVFVAVIAVVGGLITFLVARFDRTWAKVVGIVGTLALTAVGFWLVFGVMQIFSPVDFIAGLLFLFGFLLSLIWGIMALVAGARHRTGVTGADAAIRRWVPATIGVLSVVSIAGFFLTKDTVSAEEAAGATPVEMVDFEFDPEGLDTSGKLLVHNADPFAHDFTLDELDIYVQVGPGSDAIVDLSSAEPGTYQYYCGLHTDPETGEGMTGEVTITG